MCVNYLNCLLGIKLGKFCMLHLFNLKCSRYKNIHFGWEPWTCGYGRRLMIKRSWVRITATHTRWIIFTFICWKIVWLFEKTENKLKRGRGLSHSNKNIRFHGVEKLLLIFTHCVNCKQNTNANVIKLLFTSFSKSSSSSNENKENVDEDDDEDEVQEVSEWNRCDFTLLCKTVLLPKDFF